MRQQKGADRAGEAVFVCGEGADGSRLSKFLSLFRAAPFAASMAVAKTGDDWTAPQKAGMIWRADGRNLVVPRGMAAEPSGEESSRRPFIIYHLMSAPLATVFGEDVIRASVGLEDAEDLIEDLLRAVDLCQPATNRMEMPGSSATSCATKMLRYAGLCSFNSR